MSRRRPDPWGDYRRDRDDITTAAAFFMTFALLGLVAWAIFFGTAWLLPAAANAIPSLPTRAPSIYTSSSVSSAGVTFPITSTTSAVQTAGAASSSTARPTATPTPRSTTTKLRIANTGGDGVYLRRSANDTDLWIPWPETTLVDYLSDDQANGERTYKKVRDPRGNVGWMPAEYLTPAG